jgi:hypothetical protein
MASANKVASRLKLEKEEKRNAVADSGFASIWPQPHSTRRPYVVGAQKRAAGANSEEILQVFLNVLMFIATIGGLATLFLSFFGVCGAAVFFGGGALAELIIPAPADAFAIPEPNQWKIAGRSQ